VLLLAHPRIPASAVRLSSKVLGILAGISILVCSGHSLAHAEANAVKAPHVEVQLLADTTTVAPGRDATLGVRFVLQDDWHVYWRNPGDSGEAPSVAWKLPPGFRAGEIQWPAPRRIPVGPLTNFGYDKAILLPIALHVPSSLPDASTVEIGARVRWLVCDPEECIPGEAQLSLHLPTGATPAPSTAIALFDEARRRLPEAAPSNWQLSATATGDRITLTVHGAGEPPAQPPVFFPYSREAIEPSAAQPMTRDGEGFRLTLQRWPQASDSVADGILTVGDKTYSIAVPFVNSPPQTEEVRNGLNAQALLFAFLGGLLLNLMPCVFPVLALKALALAGLAGEGRRRARTHGLLYGLGVVVSFWVLAGALLMIRAGGEQLGWGFQLQTPVVVAGLAALFFWMALTLLDVTSVGASLMGVGNRMTIGEGYRSAFFTGVLATVVATPCTAPFMGTALGYALTQPAPLALAIFTSLALGLAAPYVVVTIVPALGAHLPRPGAWMELIKQFLAFPLLATVVWLVWVVSLQGGPPAVLATLSVLLLIAFAAWLGNRSATRWARGAVATALVAAAVVGGSIVPLRMERAVGGTFAWEPYSTARLDELLRQGKPVFVDFTAAWCVTCQVNKQLVLETAAVTDKMRELGIVAIRADWTRPNADISRALQQFGRDGIPLYVLYSGRENDPPRILPQILTSEIVITELEQLERGSKT
jgi:thiol:disulfide interchange protein DsbD